MQKLPDAPWIREAERYGYPEIPDPVCPCCGYIDPERIYIERTSGSPVGCDHCLDWIEGGDWAVNKFEYEEEKQMTRKFRDHEGRIHARKVSAEELNERWMYRCGCAAVTILSCVVLVIASGIFT